MSNLLDKATDPHQYDNEEMGWLKEGASLNSPTRMHFWHYLLPYVNEWQGKKVLDVGAGTGWFLDQIQKLKVENILGVEPSIKNIEYAKKYFPDITIREGTLENYKADTRFDVITSIMSFLHIRDLDEAFSKISGMLHTNGEFFAIVPDYNHLRTPRHGYEIELEELDPEEYVVKIKRPHGTMVEIVRQINKYEVAAKKHSMILTEHIPMIPSEILMEQAPKFKEFQSKPMTHLLRFKKIAQSV